MCECVCERENERERMCVVLDPESSAWGGIRSMHKAQEYSPIAWQYPKAQR